MGPGESKIIKDKQGREIIIIFPDSWPTYPIEAYCAGVSVGSLIFDDSKETPELVEISVIEQFKNSGIAKELIKATNTVSSTFIVSRELTANLAVLAFIEHCIVEKYLPASVLQE